MKEKETKEQTVSKGVRLRLKYWAGLWEYEKKTEDGPGLAISKALDDFFEKHKIKIDKK